VGAEHKKGRQKEANCFGGRPADPQSGACIILFVEVAKRVDVFVFLSFCIGSCV
jgi:hypothetical protein